MILLLLNILIQYIIQIRIGWIRHNSIGKQKLFTEKIFGREFHVVSFTRFC